MYLSAHRMKIEAAEAVPQDSLEKGMICLFKYKGQKSETKLYMALVLNKAYLQKMHALTLDPINLNYFDSWAEKLGLVFSPRMKKIRKLNVGKLVMEQSSQRFYTSEIKDQIRYKSALNFSYRTFWVKDIKSLQVINYGFSFIDEKYLKEMKIV